MSPCVVCCGWDVRYPYQYRECNRSPACSISPCTGQQPPYNTITNQFALTAFKTNCPGPARRARLSILCCPTIREDIARSAKYYIGNKEMLSDYHRIFLVDILWRIFSPFLCWALHPGSRVWWRLYLNWHRTRSSRAGSSSGLLIGQFESSGASHWSLHTMCPAHTGPEKGRRQV